MLGSDWRKLAKVIGLGLAGLTAFLFVLFVGYQLGASGGYFDAQADGYAAQYPHDTDQRVEGCFAQGAPPSDTRECVEQAIQASQEGARAEQDLSAQRQMSYWAFWLLVATLVGLPLTAIGLVLLLQTIWQGQEALRQAKNEARPYLFIDKFDIERHTFSDEPDKFEGSYAVTVWLKNFGTSPARNIRTMTRCYLTGDLAELEPLDIAKGFVEAGVAAPGHHRRTFDNFFIPRDVSAGFEWGEAYVVMRIVYLYTDDAGSPFEEAFDYFMNAEGLIKKIFYILSDRTRENARIEREQRELFAREDEAELFVEDDASEKTAKPAPRRKPGAGKKKLGQKKPPKAIRPVGAAKTAAKAAVKPKPKPKKS